MQIANPIYDAVFKYLLEDTQVAIMLLSKIIEEEIVDLELAPQEFTADFEEKMSKNKRKPKRKAAEEALLTVYRLDFAARVKKENGELELIIIEIQKAKLAADIIRFRKYLGGQYANQNNVFMEMVNGKPTPKAIPIRIIYFIGYGLEHISGVPVLKIQRQYIDVANKNPILVKDSFIEGLTHDAHVVCIQDLKGKKRTELERMLSVFDQTKAMLNTHLLQIDEKDYPEEYGPIIRRLQKASVDVDIRNKMDLEDIYYYEFGMWERAVFDAEQKVEEAEQKAEEANQKVEEAEQKAEEANQKAEEANQKAEEANQKAEEAEQKAEEANQKAAEAEKKAKEAEQETEAAQQKLAEGILEANKILLDKQLKAVRNAVNMGLSHQQIAEMLDVTLEQVEAWATQQKD